MNHTCLIKQQAAKYMYRNDCSRPIIPCLKKKNKKKTKKKKTKKKQVELTCTNNPGIWHRL